MVGAEVQDRGDPRPEALHRLELKGRDLEHGDVESFADEGEGRRPDVSRDPGAQTGCAQHGLDQEHSGRLAVGARHGDDRDAERPARQLDVAPDPACPPRVSIARDSRARNDEVEVSRIRQLPAGPQLDVAVELAESRERRLGGLVCRDYTGTLRGAEVGRAASGDAQAQHQYVRTFEIQATLVFLFPASYFHADYPMEPALRFQLFQRSRRAFPCLSAA